MCRSCGKEFDVLHKLTKHITAIHSAPKKFQCEICSKFYKENKHLKEHMLVHTGIKKFKCSHCAKTFARKQELKVILHTIIFFSILSLIKLTYYILNVFSFTIVS